MQGLYWFKFSEHELKEARSASFRIFQLVLGCVYVVVWLACQGFGFLVTLSFYLSFDVFAWLLICVLNVKMFSRSPCTRRFPTDRSETIRKIKFGKFLLKIRAIRAYAFLKLSWLVWLLFECFSYCF